MDDLLTSLCTVNCRLMFFRSYEFEEGSHLGHRPECLFDTVPQELNRYKPVDMLG